MKVILHQTHITVCDLEQTEQYLRNLLEEGMTIGEPELHIFPELFLCGYPLQDLVLQKSFYEKYHQMLERLNEISLATKGNDKKSLLLGGLKYHFDEEGVPKNIFNGVYSLHPGGALQWLTAKQLLPNYDIFDERKYYTSGQETRIWQWQGLNIGILVCEDMWPSSFYKRNPVDDLAKSKDKLHLVVNLSASPFHLGKTSKRFNRAKQISSLLSCPYIYVNKVGGEDEILFDGESFINEGDRLLAMAKSFESDILEFDLSIPFDEQKSKKPSSDNISGSAWEELFRPNLNGQVPLRLNQLSGNDFEKIIQALGFGLQEYATKNGFNHFTVALSGGLDSALVLTLIHLNLKKGQTLEAIYMPGQFSAGLSHDLSLELCQNLGIRLKVLPIKFLHSTTKNAFLKDLGEPLIAVADENVQSRLRGLLIYGRSNQKGGMVVNTSNKSEIAVGYSTQYGDSVGAISMLGDLYKSEVFQLANYINATKNNLIPQGIIDRPPSAELRPDQKDTDSLPPYEELDTILEGILSYRYTKEDLILAGLSKENVNKTFDLYRKSEFKRFQFCPIIKLRSKSFGFGYRNPLSKRTEFYF